ncbi:MAG: hypothetical protein H8D82_01725, partial [Euryarchaeota archaeon]|nr:hypothetical protein [Euryarchaeota archaeon]
MQADTESQFINDDSDFDPTESPAPNKLTDSVNEFFSSAKIAFRNDGIHALKEPTIGAAVGALAMVIIIIIASLSFLMINSASNNDQEGGDNVVIDDESNEPLESWEMQATTRSGFDLPIDECQAFSFGGEQQEIRRIYYRRNSSEPDWWENRTYNEAGEMLTECKVYPDKNVAGEFYEKTYNVWEHSTITRMDNARANSNGEPGISSWTNYSYSIDDNGNVLNSTYYSSMAGEEIVFFHKIYDGDLLIQTNYSPFGDGVNIENYTYDESGLLTSSEFYYEELGGDYKGHGYTNTSFNDDGLKIKEETYYWDFAEGEIDEQIDIYNITRAASGEIISREYYSKSLWDDGDSDAVESEAWDNYSYDLVDGGYWHNSTQDNNCEHELYMYNGEENFQSDQIFEEKNDCEGNKTSEWSKTLDDEGNLLQLVGHYAIGTNNSYRTWTNHTYDDEGNELSKLYETSEAGSVNYREYTYDSNGNMLSSAYYRNWN